MRTPVAHEGNRLLDHYKDLEDFELDLTAAGNNASTFWEEDFLKQLNFRYKTFGAKLYLSKSQADSLRNIAGKAK